MRINSGGNVGIGTNSPGSKLHVETSATSLNIARFINTSTTNPSYTTLKVGQSLTTGNVGDMQFTYIGNNNASNALNFGFNGNGGLFNILNSGNVGIGTGSPLNKLDVDGDIVASGNITSFGTVSDQRLKENVVNLTGSLDKINQLRTVSFIWKEEDPIPESRQGTNDTGLIAQEVEEIIPEVIDSAKLVGGNGEEYKKINYEKLTTYLIGAMQEQNTLIQELRQRIEILENN